MTVPNLDDYDQILQDIKRQEEQQDELKAQEKKAQEKKDLLQAQQIPAGQSEAPVKKGKHRRRRDLNISTDKI